MGVDHPFYGGVYDRPAYWSLVNASSIYRGDAKAGFRRLNASGGDMAFPGALIHSQSGTHPQGAAADTPS